MFTLLSGSSIALSALSLVAEFITKPYALLTPFLGQVMGTSIGGYVQAVNPF